MKSRDVKMLMIACLESGSPLTTDIAAHILQFNPLDIDALRCFAEYHCSRFPNSDEANAAIQAVYDAVKADESNLKRWIDIGEIEYCGGNYFKSEKAYKIALGIDKDCTAALIGIAGLVEHPDTSITNEEAISYLNASIRLDPGCHDAFYMIAICYARNGDYAKALNALERALAILGKYDTIARDITQVQYGMIIEKAGMVKQNFGDVHETNWQQ